MNIVCWRTTKHHEKIDPTLNLLKVALSQKILENFYITNINIPNHYAEQKIWIRCLLFLNFLLRIVIWSINSPVSSDLKPPLKVHTLCSCNPTTAFILWTINFKYFFSNVTIGWILFGLIFFTHEYGTHHCKSWHFQPYFLILPDWNWISDNLCTDFCEHIGTLWEG